MSFDYKINPELDIPIYKQLFDAISTAIKKGELADKDRLPTVQEMSDSLGVARGTVKKTYDELEKIGLLEKVQGRGTFVNFQSGDSLSRKDCAMMLIDQTFNDLEALGFSASEINIFLNLKLKERAQKSADVKIALLECNEEILSHVSEQMHTIPHIELYSYLLDSVRQYPYKLDEGFDMAVTTEKHAEETEKLLPQKTRMVRAALRLTPACLFEIIRIKPGAKVGIVSYSERFGELLYGGLKSYNEDVLADNPVLFGDSKVDGYISQKDVILLPENYEKYCSEKTRETLNRFGGKIITCSYELDEGTYLYIREKTKKILNSKEIQTDIYT